MPSDCKQPPNEESNSPHNLLSRYINSFLHLSLGDNLQSHQRNNASFKIAHLIIASVVVITIVFVGAAVLQVLEQPVAIGQLDDYNMAVSIMESRLNATEFKTVYTALQLGQIKSQYLSQGDDQVKFGDAVFLMLLVACAIGSGDYTSKSTAGHVFIMCYGTLAIVCTTYALFVIAETLFASILWSINTTARRDITKSPRARGVVLILLLLVFICIGGGVFSATNEGLSYVNAMYYSWSILATYGLGNIAADTTAARTIVSLYALVGVGIWASAVNFFIKAALKTTELPDGPDESDSDEDDETTEKNGDDVKVKIDAVTRENESQTTNENEIEA